MRTFNEFQTELTDELLSSLEPEVKDELFDILNNVEFVKRLVSPDRKRAKDLERDEDGKIIVDILDPHILENMEYFRPAGNHFKKYGVYTQLKPNGNPNSEFGKWLKEEIRRSWEGYIRPSDGEWITGDMYFYLNYSPIQQTKVKKGKKKGERITDLPEVWEGIYLRYHYWHQASKGGKYDNYIGGKMAAEIAKRGSSKSYCMASSLTKHFLIGESAEACREIRSLITAYQKEYLVKDGTLNKFVSMIDFNAEYTEFPAKRLKSSFQEMTWKLGYLDANTGVSKGLLNEVIGVSSRDDTDKIRGKRATKIFIEEFGCHLQGTEVLLYNLSVKKIEDVVIGDILMGDDGTPRKVLDTYSGVDTMYKIKLSNNDYHIVNSKHKVYYKKYDWYTKQYTTKTATPEQLLNIKGLNKGYYIPKANLTFDARKVTVNPYFLGLWLGDGDSTRLSISNADYEVLDWLQTNYLGTVRDLKQSEICKVFSISRSEKYLYNEFNKYRLLNNKHIPEDYKYNDKTIQLQVIAGLLDSDGTYNKTKNFFEITQIEKRKHIILDLKFMCESLGFKCSLDYRIGSSKKPESIHWRLRISGDVERIPTKINRKQAIQTNKYRSKNCWTDYTFKVEECGIGKYHGVHTDGNHLFVLKDLTITHNCFPRISDIHRVMMPSVSDGDIVFGQIIYCGTGGSENSDFSGALDMMYNPKGFDIYALPNIYDKNSQGKVESIFFFGAYLNKKPYYNEDGVSDVIAALISILQVRFNIKYNSADVTALTRTKAENPITIQEAIMKRDSTIYPVSALTDVENDLNVNPHLLDDIFVCSLEMKPDGSISPKPEYDNKPIREFPHQDNKLRGACEIYKLPELSKETNKPVSGRYIAGIDTYDDDSSDTLSLGSILIMDSWTDMIVFEYTGRPMFADDFYEICRRALLFYNARANYEAHPYDQIVRLPNGTTKLWGDIKIGDELFSPNGNTVKVIDIPMDGEDDIYNITFVDGRQVKASSSHIWNVYTLNNRNKTRGITTKEMFDYGALNKFNQMKFYIPKHDAVEYPSKNVDIDPYTLGMLIAEGALTKFKKDKHQKNKRNAVQISSCKGDALYYKNYIPYDMKYIGTKGCSYHLYIEDIDIKLNKLGLLHKNSHTKFIPQEYLNNDFNTRLELLKGLMDGDGHANPRGGSIYVTVSKQLADDIMLLIRSLGIYCKLEKSCNSFRIRISSTIPIFKLPRKVKNQYVYSPNKIGSKAKGFLNKVGIKSIEYVGVDKCKCVTVDSDDGLYLIGDYITTHNCNKKGLFAYFSRYNSLYLLTDVLEFLKDKDLAKGESIGNKTKGTNSTEPIKKYSRVLNRNWLLKEKVKHTEVDGVNTEVTYPQLQDMRQKALIKELCLWNADGNFDRHDALSMVNLLREDRMIITRGMSGEDAHNQVDKDYLGIDPFFEQNYKSNKSSNNNNILF